jgi:hypothetical protein
VEAEGRIVGGCGGDSPRRRPFIASGGAGRKRGKRWRRRAKADNGDGNVSPAT